MNLINSYASLPEEFFIPIRTDTAPAPELIAWNGELATHLGLDSLEGDEGRLAEIFSGGEPLPGGRTIAMAYAGHQFGHFVPQLGDGRAALLGEAVSPIDRGRYDIQLKGSGQTPFSRRGDGKSSLGPVIREYLLSEAMHRLGIPTTRALAAVATGEAVIRNGREPGGVLTRVASGHARVGTFEYFAVRNRRTALARLADYVIERHYPHAADAALPFQALFTAVVEAHAKLVAHWMAVGFIHGVMNTDNTAISGETLDYGPCAFMDEFHFDKVFSSIDEYGRYAYGRQAEMAQWNLARLAECLLKLDDDREAYESALERFLPLHDEHYHTLMAEKLGLAPGDSTIRGLTSAWLAHLQHHGLDYSQSFRLLAEQLAEGRATRFGEFETRWIEQIDRQPGGREAAARRMARRNPAVIPRNHQVARAIEAAFQGDLSVFHQLRQALSEPFTLQPGLEHYAEPPLEHERIRNTFCGT